VNQHSSSNTNTQTPPKPISSCFYCFAPFLVSFVFFLYSLLHDTGASFRVLLALSSPPLFFFHHHRHHQRHHSSILLFLIVLFVLFFLFFPVFVFLSPPSPPSPARHSSFRSSRHCLMPLLCGMSWFVDVAIVVGGRGGRMLR
jgi:hypothetical protein